MSGKSKFLIVFLGLFMAIKPLYCQVAQTHGIAAGFLQIKDELNLGMVFDGAQLEYRYGLLWKINEHEMAYQPKLGLGLVSSREMLGAQLNIAPVNILWKMKLYEQNGHTIKGGFGFITDYNYQIYPFLHGGYLFWASEIGVSPVIQYDYQWENKRIGAGLRNSLFGFTSNIQEYDPHYFSLAVKEFFVRPHEDLRFGSFNNYNRTNLSLMFVPDISKKHSFAYEFDYSGFFYGNQFHRINHNLIWKISL